MGERPVLLLVGSFSSTGRAPTSSEKIALIVDKNILYRTIKSMIEKYIWLQKDETKQILIDTAGDYAYFFVLAWSNASIDIQVNSAHANVKCAVLLLSPDSKKHSRVDFSLLLAASNTKGNVILLSFLGDNASSHLHGKIDLASWIQEAEAYLSEEILVLGKNVTIKSSPQLFVGSKNVKASHGASIQRLHPEKLFYMRSRGVSLETARTLLIRAYIQKTMQFVGLSDEKLQNEIENILWVEELEIITT